jgi:Zn-dependent alcohol dehydrogenase
MGADSSIGPVRVPAALMTAPHEPLVVDEVELAPPRRDEVLVRVLASGICRSDLSYMDGKWPIPCPVVLGHEGAGTIEAVGEGVDPGRVGESVVLTFAPSCGRCRFCLEGRVNLCSEAAACMDAGVLRDGTTRLSWRGATAYHLAFVSSFATHAVCPANAAIPVTDAVPAERELALALGATHVVDPARGDPAQQIRVLVPGGVDHAFEAIGNPDVAAQAFASVRDGGTTTLIGQPAIGVRASFPVYDVTQFEHTILGSNLGGASPALHVPPLARLAAAGRLDLAALVTHRFPLDQINEAVALTASGEAGRVVITMP